MVPAIQGQQAAAPPAQLDRLPATEAGKPAQPHRKQQDQQDADQEGGQRDPEQRQRHEDLAQERASAQGGIHAHRNAQCQRQHGSNGGQFHRGGEALGNQARHLGTLAQAQAEFPLQGIGEKVPELHEERLIKSQIGAQRANLLRRGVLPQKEDDRVTHVLKQQKRDEGHRSHDDYGLKQAAQDKSEHGL